MAKKLRMIEAFAGIGSQIAAMKRLGVDIENVGISEIDKYAVQSYEAINGKVNNYGDITKVEKFDPTDLLIYSSPCFTGDTKILVQNKESNEQEYIQIKDFNETKFLIVTVDEENNIITDNARLLKQGIKKVIKIICSNGIKEFIRCTPEHKFKVYKTNNNETEWIEAQNLKYKTLVRLQEMNNQKNYLIPVVPIGIEDSGEEEVYDISCEKYHWFFVKINDDAVLVHNCQDFSQAGLQRGLVDADGNQTRSGLLLEVARLLQEYQKTGNMPKYLLMENVKALVNKKFKDKFEMWLQALDLFGYNNYWKVLNAKDYGIPQNRERIFIVSIRKDIDKQTFSFPEKIPLKHRLKDLLEEKVDEKYYISNEKRIMLCEPKERFFKQAIETFEQNECNAGDTIDAFNKRVNNSGCCPTLTTRPEGFKTAILPVVNPMGYNYYNKSEIYDITPTQTLRIRKLTPLECWRLMGFTDEEFDLAKKSGVSNSQLYKQAGNSIVVDCLCFIFWKLLQGTEYEPENGFKTDWLEELFK